MEHDPSASQATFVEIAFGINLLWAAFERFRDLFRKSLADRLSEQVARIETTEVANEHNRGRLNNLIDQVQKFRDKHAQAQEVALNVAKFFTVVAAIACVAVMYFDLAWRMGKWAGLLLAPLPAYIIFAAAISGYFWLRIRLLSNKYTAFVNTFEQCPQTIKAKIESLASNAPSATAEQPEEQA